MNRINVFAEQDDYDATLKLVGWFDRDAAEKFAERKAAFDGANLAGVHLRDQNAGQVLYHTAGGRWVLHEWSAWQGTEDQWSFIGVDDAREWLLINGDDDAIEFLFGAPVEPERGPGQPPIGPEVRAKMPPELIARIDAEAEREGVTRSEAIRRLLGRALGD
jgi:hypothetical protein